MELLVALTAGSAAGIASTAHCAAMCGPLALGACGDLRPSVAPALRYGLARLGAYAVTGTLAGALGGALLRPLHGTPLHAVAAVAAGLALALSALRLLRSSPAPGKGPSLVPLGRRAPSKARAWGMGVLTALLPCGASAAALLLAASTGSALHGGASMTAFALASVPGLAAVFASSRLGASSPLGPWLHRRRPLVAAALMGAALLTASRPWRMEREGCHCHRPPTPSALTPTHQSPS